MIRVPGDSELEIRLLQQTGERLRDRRKQLDGYSKLLENAMRELPGLSATERLKFRLLHRQFGGHTIPGLPSAVAAGRFLIRSFRKLRGS